MRYYNQLGVYNQSWSIKQLGISATTKKLSIPFRCTKQIDALAESLRIHNDDYLDLEDKSAHIKPQAEGSVPVIVHCSSRANEKSTVITIVSQWIKENPNITIGILAMTNKQLSVYSEWLTDAGMKHEIITKEKTFSLSKAGVKLATIFSAKGLEFVRVIIPRFEEGIIPKLFEKTDEDLIREELVKTRNIAYVGMTRAMQTLVITYSGTPSRFISEFETGLYALKEEKIEITKGDKAKTGSGAKQYQRIESGNNNESSTGNAVAGASGLYQYFIEQGLEVIDKRDNNGCLWVVGDQKKLAPYLEAVKKRFHAYGNFGAGKATKQREGWFTKCKA